MHTAPGTDRNIHFDFYQYDWYRVQSLNMALRDGRVPPEYRSDLFPAKGDDASSYFQSRLPNWTVIEGSVVTFDNCLILTRTGKANDFQKGTFKATFGEQMRAEDNSPFDAFRRGLEEELPTLTIAPHSLRLLAVVLGIPVNDIGLTIVGRCYEESAEIKRGTKADSITEIEEIRTVHLKPADEFLDLFFSPLIRWNDGTCTPAEGYARLNMIAALCYVHGYREAMRLLCEAHAARSKSGST